MATPAFRDAHATTGTSNPLSVTIPDEEIGDEETVIAALVQLIG
jgi:hypothetical protein